MSGAGRKHRAKHLTRQYLDAEGWLGPKEGESLAVCLESPHGQHLRVLVMRLAAQLPPPCGEEGKQTKDESDAQNGPSSSSGGGNIARRDEEAVGCEDARLSRQLVLLPGKFHKVIWLSIRDVVVVADGNVQLKPSPEQLANFLRLPENAEYKELVSLAQRIAQDTRLAMERAPLHTKATTTTTSALPTSAEERAREQDRLAEAVADGGGDRDDDSDDDSLNHLVNPNRANIRHRQQYFYVAAEDEEEEEGEEEEKDEEVDHQ